MLLQFLNINQDWVNVKTEIEKYWFLRVFFWLDWQLLAGDAKLKSNLEQWVLSQRWIATAGQMLYLAGGRWRRVVSLFRTNSSSAFSELGGHGNPNIDFAEMKIAQNAGHWVRTSFLPTWQNFLRAEQSKTLELNSNSLNAGMVVEMYFARSKWEYKM